MNKKIKKLIEKFIIDVKVKYPELYVGYDYLVDLDCYQIWHNDKYLEFQDKNFRKYTSKILSKYFIEKDIYNVFMTYDYEKSLTVDTTKYIFVDDEFGKCEPVGIKSVIFDYDYDYDNLNKINLQKISNKSLYNIDTNIELKVKSQNNKSSINEINALAAWGKYGKKWI